jgi:starch-binding outer membrane protein, SusD/RagB family
MNKIKKTILMRAALFMAIMGVLGACKDSFLEVNPQARLSASSLGTKAGIEATLIGAYSILDGYHIDNNNTWPSDPVNWIMGSVPTDDAYKGSEQGDGPENTLFELYQWQPGNSFLGQKYVPMYEGVSRANAVINLVNGATGVDDIKDRVLGEALFLRAYYHFELYKPFGRIVYMNEEDAKNLNFFKPNEDDPDNVLALIAADLEDAITKLPPTQANKGRINQVAAKAFLGKVYMYARKFDLARTNLRAVVVGSEGNLAACQRDLFTYSTENGPEALFSVQMSLSNPAQARNSNWLNQLANPVGGGFGCCGFHQPSQNLINAFKVTAAGIPDLDNFNAVDLNPATDFVDPRLDLVAGRDGVPYWDWAVHDKTFIRSRSYSGPYSPKKFQPYSTSPIVAGGWNGAANNGVNVPVIRLADAMLLLAEAELEAGGLGIAEALRLVNLVRDRAGNCAQGAFVKGGAATVMTTNLADPAITWATYRVEPYASFPDAAYAKKAVRYERRLELAMEGHRLFDLRRWDDMEPGYAANVLNAFVAHEKIAGKTGIDQITGARDSYYKDAEPFAAKHRWFPLPTSEVELATVNGVPVLKQNPGY